MEAVRTSVVFSLPEARAARLAAILPIVATVALFATLVFFHASLFPVLGAFGLVLMTWARWFGVDYLFSHAESGLKFPGFFVACAD
jgi:hypothetical protein